MDKIKNMFLIFHGRFPSEKAASVFAAKSCEAFAEEGLEVTLLVPKRIGRFSENAYNFYGIKNNFKIVFLPTIDLFPLKKFESLAFRLNLISFSLSCLFYLFFKAKKDDIVYSNETLPLFLSSYFFKNTFYEIHDFPEKKFYFYKKLFKRLKYILATNNWKKKKLEDLFSIDSNKIIYEPNAVDIDYFNNISKEESRNKFNLSLDKKIVVYGGHLYGWKGVDVLAESINYLPEDILVVFAGGTDIDTENFKKKYSHFKNIFITGYITRSDMFYWQKLADVLVLPNTAKEDISKYYTSPMKLFDYMASKNPIVASNIPSITEILNKKNSILVEPDNPKVLAEKIIWFFDNRKKTRILSEQAFKDVQKHTWQERAKRIISNF